MVITESCFEYGCIALSNCYTEYLTGLQRGCEQGEPSTVEQLKVIYPSIMKNVRNFFVDQETCQ